MKDVWDWIRSLGPEQYALDLGAGAGSLKSLNYACTVISVDCDAGAFRSSSSNHPSATHAVLAAGDVLPFPSATFDVVLCHHVLEHVAELSQTLSEIARVLKPDGRVYISVPDGRGLCDRIYRYVFNGGDHVNQFTQLGIVSLVERTIGIQLTHWVKLYASFAYLARTRDLDRRILPSLPTRLRTLARTPTALVLAGQAVLYVTTRLADLLVRNDWALYGWALYFERVHVTGVVEMQPYINVCFYCGSGHPADQLVRKFKLLFQCPTCGRWSIYFPPYGNGL
jgi:SAM-dependent methyltransferase